MTKYTISLFSLLLFISCDSRSQNKVSKKKEVQTLLSKKEQLAHDFENNKLTKPFDFYTGVVAEFSLIQMHLLGIMKLMQNKAAIEEITKEAKIGADISKRVFKKLRKIKAIGVGGSSLLNKCNKYAEFTELVFNDIVEKKGKFDFSNTNVSTLISSESDFVDYQETYASSNNFKLGKNINIDEMYEESKKSRKDKK